MTDEKKVIIIGKRKVEITNETKILFPKSKICKKDLVEYYKKIGKTALPLMKDRPVTMFRYPNGIHKEHFVQKNISDYFPGWVQSKLILKQDKTNARMLLCNDLPTLVYLANQGCITPHVWLSRIDKLHYPDRLIFDLDPGKKNFEIVCQCAFDLKGILEKLKLVPFIMTTGSRGVHIIVPIKREYTFDKVRSFAKKIALELATLKPKIYTTELRKEKRRARLFIDVLRNAYAQTAVSPYAVRALEKAPVATPILWKELKPSLDLFSFNIQTVPRRVSKPFKDIEKKARSLSFGIEKIS